MSIKPFKNALKIKLSSETSEKLQALSAEKDNFENLTSKDIDKVTNTTPEVSLNTDKCVVIEENVAPNIESSQSEVSESENNSKSLQQSSYAEYAEHIHYEEGIAIYTDPSTKQQYVWCTTSNQWIVRSQNITNNPESDNSTQETTNSGGAYGYEDGKRTYTDTDGSIYFWDEEKSAWLPKVDDNFLAHYQMAYGFVDNSTEKPNVEQPIVDDKKEFNKKKPEEPKWFDLDDTQNNKVYVSNLPLDITEEEFLEIMQKCGLIMKDPITHKMKVKLYTKPNSHQLKGDALCTYIKVESVDLALKILDGYAIRNHRIKVQRAKFQMKGDFNPSLKPKKKKKKDKEKLKKMQERLFDWRPEKMRGEHSKHERIVIVKNLFDPSLFDSKVDLILEYQQDLREECSKCGEVKKVFLYDRHPDGIAQIIMKEPEEAENVVKLINGRWFGKRQLTAEIWDGKTKYKIEETDSDLNKRIDEWNKFLDDGDDKMNVDNVSST